MRLDKFLKVSRLIKRRTVANEACSAGKVLVNDKVAKASSDVQVGDMLQVTFGQKTTRARIEIIAEHATKEHAESMYTIIQ